MDADKLRELIQDDEFGLLEVKPKQSDVMSEDERLVASFFEIVDFYKQQGREPDNDMTNVQEARLAMRLAALRANQDQIKALIDLDEFRLLVTPKKPATIDDILADDDLNLLGGRDEESIFVVRDTLKTVESPDYVAQRQHCKDFGNFAQLFTQCHEDLQSGKRTLRPFVNEQQIKAGEFFVLRGVLAYVADVGNKERKNKKVNARLRCIFENETESDLLLRSLARNLYKDGRRVTEHANRLMDELNNITDEDGQTGYIYILKSLCSNPELSSIKDLYKIGFSSVPVEARILKSEEDPTFLMGKVSVIETFECFNLNPQKLELLLHRFFGKVCLSVDVFDRAGKRYTPREWFIAPLPVIEEAIELIISGKIVDCVYDDETRMILMK